LRRERERQTRWSFFPTRGQVPLVLPCAFAQSSSLTRSHASSRARLLPVFRFLFADPCVRPHGPRRARTTRFLCADPGWLHRFPAPPSDKPWLHRRPAPLNLLASPPLDKVSLTSSLSLCFFKKAKACMWRAVPCFPLGFLLERLKLCMPLSPALFVCI
jgi:hypothetical protein